MESTTYNSIDELEAQLINFKILFVYYSNKIENENITFHDIREIFENGKVISYTGDLRTLFEISNQKDCYHILLDYIDKKEKLSFELIKTIHYQLTNGTYDKVERAGELKKHDYVTGLYEVGSSPENVENDLQSFIDEINDDKGNDYLTVVAYFHAMFENIHPFFIDNGRVGRTLLNYYLIIHNLKPLIIYEKDRNIYYDCLEKFDIGNDLEPLKNLQSINKEKHGQKKNIRKNQ